MEVDPLASLGLQGWISLAVQREFRVDDEDMVVLKENRNCKGNSEELGFVTVFLFA